MKKLYIFILLLLATTVVWAMPEFKAPEFMRLTVVADKMTLNGMDMKTYTFESSKPVAEIEKFYQELWSGKAKQTKVVPWNILSYADDGLLYVVQIREDNPLIVTGLLSISDLKTLKKKFVRGKGFPMPDSSVVINDITGNDSGKRSRTLVIENTKSVADNLRYYRRHFNKKGWIELAENANASGRKFGAPALIMNKGGDELNMAFTTQNSKTLIVAVQVDK